MPAGRGAPPRCETGAVEGLSARPAAVPDEGDRTGAGGPGSAPAPSAPGPAPLVVVEELTKVYDPSPVWMRFLLRSAISEPVVALERVSLSVPAGGITAIVGPNGAGKSTLFRVLSGLTSPTSGSALIDGVDVANAPRGVRAMIGFVPSGDQTLYLRLTSVDNLAFHGRLQGIARPALPGRIAEVLELVGLSDAADRAGFALSAGMRARLQLARALLGHPRLLILDEPTAAIDPVGAYELLGLIQSVAAERGTSVLLSSHRLEEIEALGNHLVLMDRGRIVYDGGLASLRRHWQRPRVLLRFATPQLAGEAATILAALDVEVRPGAPLHDSGVAHRSGGSPASGYDAAAALLVSLGPGTALGGVLAALGDRVAGLVAIEEERASLREVIYGLLRADSEAAGGPVGPGPDWFGGSPPPEPALGTKRPGPDGAGAPAGTGAIVGPGSGSGAGFWAPAGAVEVEG